jgi:cation:H+ antiporter
MIITAFIVIGCIGLPIGAQMVILGGTDLARVLGVPEAVIALSLIALGTSLPELATSLMAAARQRHDLAIGNAIGSNIINILMTLGVTALIKPIPIAENFLRIDLWVMLIAALAIVPTVAARGSITRAKGMVFVLTYAIYMFVIFSLNHL